MPTYQSEIKLLNESYQELNTPIFIRFLKKSGYFILQWLCYILVVFLVAGIVFVNRIIGDFDSNIKSLQKLDELRASSLEDHYDMLYWGTMIGIFLWILVALIAASSFRSSRKRLDAVNDVSAKIIKVRDQLESKDYSGTNQV